MVNMIFVAVVSVTVIGAACGIILGVAAKFMAVEVDERALKIQEILPGSNCGACGFPGCSGYATALVSGSVGTNLCPPGGPALVQQLSEILGVDAGEIEQKLAVVRCRGTTEVLQKKMDYKGIPTCMAAKQLFSGEGACALGCLGYGDCLVVCPTDAVCMEDGLARINPLLCTGCTLCVKACPSGLITIESAKAPVIVMCKNTEKGAVVRKKCTAGCIGCRKCVKECPDGAIAVENNLAIIDYEKCSGCGRCVEVCITKCIQPSAFAQMQGASGQ